ncbi:MAG: hypothetical protein ACP5MD_00825 [Verrucomicrobiia bacterium]
MTSPEFTSVRLDGRGCWHSRFDEVVFEVLGLTAGEREAVVGLVRARLEKARSV